MLWMHSVGSADILSDSKSNRDQMPRNSLKVEDGLCLQLGGCADMVQMPKVECAALEWNQKQKSYERLHKMVSHSEMLTWVFVGDSITANDGDVSKGYRCYVEIFESYLRGTLKRVQDRIVNTAVSGWKVTNIDYERDIARYNPDIVYIKVGTNDSFTDDAAAECFLKGMMDLFEKIVASGAVPVVACANRFSSQWCDFAQTANYARCCPDMIRILAYAKNLLLVDYFGAYSVDMPYAECHYFNPDTVHPNRNGMLFHAQTLIKDLGLDRGGTIMETKAGDLSQTEVSPILLPAVDKNGFILDGSTCTFADVNLDNTYLLMGGATAVGADPTLITFRSLGQYLNNNDQLGRCIPIYCSRDSFALREYPVSTPLSTMLLMPEPYGLYGEALFVGADAGEVAALVEQALQAGLKVVLLTPVPDLAHKTEAQALADAVLKAARSKSVPVIDVYGYLQAYTKACPQAKEFYYTNGRLNFAGTNAVAMLLGTAFGMDITKISSNRITEDHTPESWGKQNVNGFRYLYRNKQTGEYAELPFVSSEIADSDVAAGRFSLAPNLRTFIGQDVLHASAELCPVKAFTFPFGGTTVITLKHRRHVADVSEGGANGTIKINAFLNEVPLTFNNGQTDIVMLAAAGCYRENTVTVEVKKGDVFYMVVDGDQAGQADVIETVTYLSLDSLK